MKRELKPWEVALSRHKAAHPCPNQHDDFMGGWNWAIYHQADETISLSTAETFYILEALGRLHPELRGYYARGTGGVDASGIVEALAEMETPTFTPEEEADLVDQINGSHSPQPNSIYSDGWRARGEYIADRREAYQGTSIGFALMIFSGMITGSLLALSLTLLPNFDRFPWGGFAGIAALGPVGWWINRAENRWSAERLTAFEEKWKSHLARSEQAG